MKVENQTQAAVYEVDYCRNIRRLDRRDNSSEAQPFADMSKRGLIPVCCSLFTCFLISFSSKSA